MEPEDLIPIRSESLDAIISRIDGDVNAGVDPSSPDFVDTTPGTFYADIRMALAMELERLWDVATTDTVAASLVDYSWGIYLDAHGATLGVYRDNEVAATGEVEFFGDAGTIVATGTEVATTQTTAEEDPVSFLTTVGDSDTIPDDGGGVGTLTLPVVAESPGVRGNVATGAINLLLSPLDGVSTVTNAAATSGGAEIETDEAYREKIRLAWSSAQGGGSVADYLRWARDYDGIGAVRVTPIWNGPGTVRVVVVDTEGNEVSGSTLAGLQALLDPYEAETALNGAQSGTPSTVTVDSTTGFRAAGLIYVNDCLIDYTGKTATTFTGCTYPAGGTLAGADADAVVQHGQGSGLAPVGAIVSVRTASTVVCSVEASLTLSDGYSLSGVGVGDAGTIQVGAEIEATLTEYINSLPPGGDRPPGVDTGAGEIRLNKVLSLIMAVPGVYEVDTLTLDTTATDFAVDADEVVEIGAVTLT